jgi:Spy/CpxP family protein refolding chaperone
MTRLLPLILIIFAFAPPLWAQQSYREFERGLNLSETQRSQVDTIKEKYIGEWRALKDESVRKRLELRELSPDRPDQRERAERLQRELNQIEASRHRLYQQYRGEVSTIFNEEQRGRYNRFIESERRRPMNQLPPQGRQVAPGRRTHGR